MNTNQTKTMNLAPIEILMGKSIEKLKRILNRPKTVYEVLADHLTFEEFQKACKYISVADASKQCKSIDEAMTSFQWSATSEGRPYWSNVFSRF